MTLDTPFVTICLTSISGRVDEVGETIETLLGQDYPAFAVRLYLSAEPFLLDEGVPEPPEDLVALAERRRAFSIHYVANIGPYRKIMPFLQETRGRRLLVATADDDTLYPPDWLSGMVAAWRQRRCVICNRGHFMTRRNGLFQPYRRWMLNGIDRNPDLFVLPTGKDGILYDTIYFHPGVFDIETALAVVPTADDLWLKWHTAGMGVPTFALYPDYRQQSLDDRNYGASLYLSFNQGGGNDKAVDRLEEYARQSFGRPLSAR